jgi:hypothetical protein
MTGQFTLKPDLQVPNRLSVNTRIVPRNEFERIVRSSNDTQVTEKTIYVVKPILLPRGHVQNPKLEKSER